MSRLSTQALNAVKRAGYPDPFDIPIRELICIPGLGPKGIQSIAELAERQYQRKSL